jgi:hypothetical protein
MVFMEDVGWHIMTIRWFFYEILWLSWEIWQLSLETSGGSYRRCRPALMGVVGGFYEREAGSYGKYGGSSGRCSAFTDEYRGSDQISLLRGKM